MSVFEIEQCSSHINGVELDHNYNSHTGIFIIFASTGARTLAKLNSGENNEREIY